MNSVTKFIKSALPFCGLLIFSYSCQDEESPFPSNDNKIRKVTLDGGVAQDTLTLDYEGGNIASVNWCTHLVGVSEGCLTGYSERRYYSDSGKLDSLSGRWDVSYAYENGLRKKMIAHKDNQYYSTTTFMEYAGIYPAKIKVEFATLEVLYVDLVFNYAGDLTRKSIKNGQGVLLEDTKIAYTSIENPLQGMIETPSYSVLIFGFDDFVFYYSKHFPDNIVTDYTNDTPVYPKNSTITYIAELNTTGKLTSANASRVIDDHPHNVHNIHVVYDK